VEASLIGAKVDDAKAKDLAGVFDLLPPHATEPASASHSQRVPPSLDLEPRRVRVSQSRARSLAPLQVS